MEIVKKTDSYSIVKKRSGRYGVLSSSNKWVNADEKIKVLAAEGLIKVTAKAKVEETDSEDQVEESAE